MLRQGGGKFLFREFLFKKFLFRKFFFRKFLFEKFLLSFWRELRIVPHSFGLPGCQSRDRATCARSCAGDDDRHHDHDHHHVDDHDDVDDHHVDRDQEDDDDNYADRYPGRWW